MELLKRLWNGKSKKLLSKPSGCPDYKRVPTTSFVVDGFKCAVPDNCHSYFLTHFHSDHYGGLTRGFNRGIIYCSQITANLVSFSIGVHARYLKVLPLHQTVEIEGVKVTCFDANHCPGAIILLFTLPDGRRILHCGDMRYHAGMKDEPALLGGKIDICYLDTTFCEPRYTFPPQSQCIQVVVDTIAAELQKSGRCLFLIGTYTIGKERVLLEVSKQLGLKICITPHKRSILEKLMIDMSGFTTEPREAQVHCVSMAMCSFRGFGALGSLMQRYDRVVAFQPTGWSQTRVTKRTRGAMTVVSVPYSEHSSFSELKEFMDWMKPGFIIPTVNTSAAAVKRQLSVLLAKPEPPAKKLRPIFSFFTRLDSRQYVDADATVADTAAVTALEVETIVEDAGTVGADDAMEWSENDEAAEDIEMLRALVDIGATTQPRDQPGGDDDDAGPAIDDLATDAANGTQADTVSVKVFQGEQVTVSASAEQVTMSAISRRPPPPQRSAAALHRSVSVPVQVNEGSALDDLDDIVITTATPLLIRPDPVIRILDDDDVSLAASPVRTVSAPALAGSAGEQILQPRSVIAPIVKHTAIVIDDDDFKTPAVRRAPLPALKKKQKTRKLKQQKSPNSGRAIQATLRVERKRKADELIL
eukprot:TRINITY_DN11384_c0_g1_i1.p1 TRINITY_DN11384_c0_g1~~TRINITY_DN11384_c0_g1_i1.p1  ORF type:complete len:656 (-),score=142.60 TRINITY_DN11384_c0_g1_i1:19-1947(-)